MKKKVRGYFYLFNLVMLLGVFAQAGLAAELEWQSSKQDAINLALQQGKKILMIAGRDA